MNQTLKSSLVYGDNSKPFFDPNFRNILDSHLEYLKVTGNVELDASVDTDYMGQFHGDFYAILTHMNITPKYHRIIMLMNGLTNPIQYEGQLTSLIIPDLTVIDRIMSVYNTGKGSLRLDAEGE